LYNSPHQIHPIDPAFRARMGIIAFIFMLVLAFSGDLHIENTLKPDNVFGFPG
jgi:hypothetical protein